MEKKPVVLVVDDEKNTRDGLARALRPQYEVLLAESGERALQTLDETTVDVMLSDVRMPGMDGMALLQKTKSVQPAPVCIMLTAYGSVETAVEAMKAGAYDFLTKPVNLDRLDILISRALHSRVVESENVRLQKELNSKYGFENIIGSSPAMQEVFDTIRQVAPTEATILLQGESGTGKELVAHAIHHLSNRAKGPFVSVHCAALSESLLESELFGHEKGSFTGADNRRVGRFEMANGGTLHLDEIGEINAAVQVKLLRVLEERCFERVGGQETQTVDIRLVTATNRDLRQRVADGKFREDLFFRLDVVSILMPPLRDRLGDIPLLADRFLKEFNEKNGKSIQGFSAEAVNVLSSYAWPGNVRELRNVVEKMVVLARGDRLTPRDVPANVRDATKDGIQLGAVTDTTLASVEKHLLLTTLKAMDGNRTKTAEKLGISRRTLLRKIAEYRKEDGELVD